MYLFRESDLGYSSKIHSSTLLSEPSMLYCHIGALSSFCCQLFAEHVAYLRRYSLPFSEQSKNRYRIFCLRYNQVATWRPIMQITKYFQYFTPWYVYLHLSCWLIIALKHSFQHSLFKNQRVLLLPIQFQCLQKRSIQRVEVAYVCILSFAMLFGYR